MKRQTCKQTLKYICENLDQKINSSKCREIGKHFDSCPDCKTYLDSLKKTVSLYKAYKNPTMSKAVEKKLFAKLRLR